MPTVAVVDMAGLKVSDIELNDKVFGIVPNATVMHRAVVTYLAAQRQGTQSALTRAEVSGGGKKPWRQKGTGHARQGSTRAPQWTHGGIVFAPKPRDYDKSLNKKERALAIANALIGFRQLPILPGRFQPCSFRGLECYLNCPAARNRFTARY